MDREKIKPKDIASAADLIKFPVLTKETVRKYKSELLSSNIAQMRVSWAKTGGTTGEPMRTCRNREDTAWASMCYERGLRWGGLGPEERRASLFGGSLGIDKSSFVKRYASAIRGDLFLPAFELRADTAAVYFDKIRRSKSKFLKGYASAIYRLARLAEDTDQKVHFDAVFPTAELLLPEWEETIRKVFTCHVLPYYGCGEINSLGYRRPESSCYFIPDEHVVIEVRQRDGSAGLSGDGEFAITDLDNYAMPLIRYVNGDAGKISYSSDSYSLKESYDELTAAIPRQEQLGSDETSHKDNGKKHWIWCITAAAFSVFHIAKTRSREVLERLVGEEFAGYLNFDYFSANCSFAWNFDVKAQYCWAHLIRDMRFLSEKHPDKKTKAWAERRHSQQTPESADVQVLHTAQFTAAVEFDKRAVIVS